MCLFCMSSEEDGEDEEDHTDGESHSCQYTSVHHPEFLVVVVLPCQVSS